MSTTPDRRDRPGRARTLTALGVVLVVLGAVALAWPWLTAPLSADERYQYLVTPALSDNSWPGVIERIWNEMPSRAETGRITPLGYLVQHVAFLAVFQLSLATGTPVVVGHALVKLVMVLLAVGAFWWFLRVLRVRGERLPSSTVRLLVPLFGVLLLLGGQTQVIMRSSWTAYPVLTTGAVAVAFAVPALVLTLVNRVSRSAGWLVPALLVTLLLAFFLNFSYELYYVAVPLTLLLLLVHSAPPVDTGAAWVRRHARLVVGAGLGLFFAIGLVWVRRTVAAICAEPGSSCYVGTEASLGGETIVVAARNLLGGIPVFAGSLVGEERLEEAPWLEAPTAFGGWGWLAALVLIAGLALLLPRWDADRRREEGADSPDPLPQRRLLAVIAAAGLALAGGSAVIMALSAQAPEIVVEIGVPYRSTTVVWAGLALAGLAGAALLATGRGAWALRGPVAAVGLVALVVGLLVWPVMAQSTRIARADDGTDVTERVHRAVLTPDLGERGDEDRCALLAAIDDVHAEGTGRRLERGATGTFELLWDRPFCAAEDTP